MRIRSKIKQVLNSVLRNVSKDSSEVAASRMERRAVLEKAFAEADKDRRVNVGSAGDEYPGWIGCDKEEFDILCGEDWKYFFEPDSIHRILAEHVFEHLTEEQIVSALTLAKEFLVPGGVWRVAIPDGNFPNETYIDYVRPGGIGAGADDHKVLLNHQSLGQLVEAAGLTPKLLEFWDDEGHFRRQPWEWEEGPVRRSANHDPRNQGGQLEYTSLIVDCVKQ